MIDLRGLHSRVLRYRVFVAIAIGGGMNALSMHYSTPDGLSFTHKGVMLLAKVFLSGAVIALIHLYQPPPAPPATT
jgi:hypothetical protein